MILNKVVRVGTFEKITFEQRLREVQELGWQRELHVQRP